MGFSQAGDRTRVSSSALAGGFLITSARWAKKAWRSWWYIILYLKCYGDIVGGTVGFTTEVER